MIVIEKNEFCIIFEDNGEYYINARCQDGFMDRPLFLKVGSGECGLYQVQSNPLNLVSLGKEIAANYKRYKSRNITGDLFDLSKEAIQRYNAENT